MADSSKHICQRKKEIYTNHQHHQMHAKQTNILDGLINPLTEPI